MTDVEPRQGTQALTLLSNFRLKHKADSKLMKMLQHLLLFSDEDLDKLGGAIRTASVAVSIVERGPHDACQAMFGNIWLNKWTNTATLADIEECAEVFRCLLDEIRVCRDTAIEIRDVLFRGVDIYKAGYAEPIEGSR